MASTIVTPGLRVEVVTAIEVLVTGAEVDGGVGIAVVVVELAATVDELVGEEIGRASPPPPHAAASINAAVATGTRRVTLRLNGRHRIN